MENEIDKAEKIAKEVINECMKQVEFLIKNSKEISKRSGGIVNLKKLDNFRDAITVVYIAGQNKGILEYVSLDKIYMFLDKGLYNETMLDMFVYTLNVKYNE